MKGVYVMAVIGMAVGGTIGALLPIHVEYPAPDVVRFEILGVKVGRSEGRPGELGPFWSNLRTMLVVCLGLVGGVVLGRIGVALSSSTDGTLPQSPGATQNIPSETLGPLVDVGTRSVFPGLYFGAFGLNFFVVSTFSAWQQTHAGNIIGAVAASAGSLLFFLMAFSSLACVFASNIYFRAGPGGISFRVPGVFGFPFRSGEIPWSRVTSWRPATFSLNFVVIMSRLEFYLEDGRRIAVRTMPFRESAQEIALAVETAAKSGDPGSANSTP